MAPTYTGATCNLQTDTDGRHRCPSTRRLKRLILSSRLVRNSVVLVVLAVFGLALLWTYVVDSGQQAPYTYSQLLTDAKAGNVEQITMDGEKLTVKVKDSKEPKTATAPPNADGSVLIAQVCAAAGVTDIAACSQQISFNPIEPSAAGQWVGLLITALLPVLLIGGFIFFMMRQAQGTNNQAMSFGKSRARMFLGNKTIVTFNDVAGVDEAKQELTEVVEFLKYPGEVRVARRAHPARRAAGRPSGHRQDAALPRRRRRGGRALLLDLRLRVRRDVRRRRRLAACATCSTRRSATRRASSSSTRSTPSAASAAPASAARTTSASRR